MNINTQKGGVMRFLIIVIAVITLASFFFNFSIQDVVENPQTQQNFNYIASNVSHLYVNYLEPSVTYLWNEIFIKLIWNNFTQDLSSMKKGESTLFEKFSPQVEVQTSLKTVKKE